MDLLHLLGHFLFWRRSLSFIYAEMEEEFSFVFTNNNEEETGFVSLNYRKPYKEILFEFDHNFNFNYNWIWHENDSSPPTPPTHINSAVAPGSVRSKFIEQNKTQQRQEQH